MNGTKLLHASALYQLGTIKFPIATIVAWFYVFSVGCVSAFSYSQMISVPFIAALILFFVTMVNSGLSKSVIKDFILIYVLFCGPLILGLISGHSFLGDKSLSHFLSYLFVPAFYYLPLRIYLARNDYGNLKMPTLIGWRIFSLIAIFEFGSVNFFVFDFSDIIYRPEVKEYDPLFLGFLTRARSLAEESAHAALFSGIAFFILLHLRVIRPIDWFLFIISMLSYWGTSSLLGLAVALIIFFVRQGIFFRLILVAGLIAVLEQIFFTLGFDIYADFIGKFQSGSASDRLLKIDQSTFLVKDDVFAQIFGLGPGYYESANVEPIIGLYALQFFQSGLLGAATLVILFVIYLFRSFNHSPLLFSGFVYSLICYSSISNYWFPWLWMLMAYIDVDYRRRFY